jgi:hypothetical protein
MLRNPKVPDTKSFDQGAPFLRHFDLFVTVLEGDSETISP